VQPAPFRQRYDQDGAPPLANRWWRCSACDALFAEPIPSPEELASHWRTVNYNRAPDAVGLHQARAALLERVLGELSERTERGPLLDVGANYGNFLRVARDAGWKGWGFDPCGDGVAECRAAGFDGTEGWCLEDAGLPAGYFAAVTALDSFCYVWHPYSTLRAMYGLLRPGGTLAMRLSNKRRVIGLAIRLTSPGPGRDERVSRLLQNQFHSVSAQRLARVMRGIGFVGIRVHRRAVTAPWAAMSWRSRVAYLGAEALFALTMGRVNESPGLLLVASKPETR